MKPNNNITYKQLGAFLTKAIAKAIKADNKHRNKKGK